MRLSRVLHLLAASCLAGFLVLPFSSLAVQPAYATAGGATRDFLTASGTLAFTAPLIAPPSPILGPNTSVMPPGPGGGAACSTDATSNRCSALVANQRCSAFNDNGNQCSTIGGGGDEYCSADANNSVCSVLPPNQGGNPSFCSAYGGDISLDSCSTIGSGSGLKCSTKGSGLSACSVIQGSFGAEFCSVFDTGAPTRSFCSTKFNQPTIAKGCSVIVNVGSCSVEQGGFGTCTAFGAANPNSCSALGGAGGHCSVINGPAGTFCVQ